MSRFILHLLAVALDENNPHFRSSQWKTLRFATVVETMAEGLNADLSRGSVSGEDTLADV